MNIRKWSGQVLTQESSKPTVRPPRLPSLAKSAPTISNVNTLLIVKEKVYMLHKNLQLSTFLKMISNGKSWRGQKKTKKKTGLLQRTMNAYLRNSALTKPQVDPTCHKMYPKNTFFAPFVTEVKFSQNKWTVIAQSKLVWWLLKEYARVHCSSLSTNSILTSAHSYTEP